MSIPVVGLILLPLCLLFWAKPVRLLEFVFYAAVFQAAAALVLGGFGVQPALVPAGAFISYFMLQRLLGVNYPGTSVVRQLAMPALLTGAWMLISSMLMPHLFRDKVLVWPVKNDAMARQVLLEPVFGNVTQDIYLLANLCIMVLTAEFLTRRDLTIARFFKAYLMSGWVVIAVCVWEFAHRVAGIPFPKTIFYSNPSWAVLDTQNIGPIPRINSTFSEPAACATFLMGIVFSTTWLGLKGYRLPYARLLMPAATAGLVLTTSTTGFAALAAGAAMLPFAIVATGSGHLLGRIGRIAMIGGALMGLGGLLVITFDPHLVESLETIAAATETKTDSQSYQDRSQTDVDSLATAQQTYGLGAGWGSNRSSSLIPGLLATSGVLGVLGLLVFTRRMVTQSTVSVRRSPASEEAMIIQGALPALAGRIVATCISGPSIDSADFYILLGVAMAAVARVRLGYAVPLAARMLPA